MTGFTSERQDPVKRIHRKRGGQCVCRQPPQYFFVFVVLWSVSKEILQICFLLLRKAFDFKMTPDMADAVRVSRALSKIINSNDDNGVLVGNWSGDYSGGVSPTTWSDSVAILKQYYTTQKPVGFGQCWVFAQVLTTVCRSLGIPCRSLTNFNSAHDANATCTIDHYFDEKGNSLADRNNDSIWNFHCWNEVWILRPDLPPGFDGWHALDSTPQERSSGKFQCGPCPVAAVCKGDIDIGYDTAFVFAEVNADEVQWVVKDDGETLTPSSIDTTSVGAKISTKKPTGTALKNMKGSDSDGSFVRQDLTENYKPKEGSEAERRSVERALRYTGFGEKLFQGKAELKVELREEAEDKKTFVGQDIIATFIVTNVSQEDRRVAVTLTARHTQYWDRGLADDNVAKTKFDNFILPSGLGRHSISKSRTQST
ncbi:protein-glutamine gamma-glutamyltransferase E-like isoform X1 [Pomacea canaliculata]|uniref:protein-glutamine gamma-glutamyltransferase E-like isoform X1 n=1 Tax=Pomacea canaliculata TaxID=400727 RepID=UPI000D72FB78|nr:protein-glutamine gamma-glutamyltransferase E-like isoform X1 [Pomacea canaliculata]